MTGLNQEDQPALIKARHGQKPRAGVLVQPGAHTCTPPSETSDCFHMFQPRARCHRKPELCFSPRGDNQARALCRAEQGDQDCSNHGNVSSSNACFGLFFFFFYCQEDFKSLISVCCQVCLQLFVSAGRIFFFY